MAKKSTTSDKTKTPAKAPAKKTTKKTTAKSVEKTSKTVKAAAKKTLKPTVAKSNTVAKKTATKKATKKVAAKTPAKKAVKKATLTESEIIKNAIVEGMEERKAENIVVMDLRNVPNAVTDFFVICQAESNTQVNAIATSVWDEVFKAKKEKPWHMEGKDNAQWILIDYVSVVAHVFQPDARLFYNIEKLWGDAEFKYII